MTGARRVLAMEARPMGHLTKLTVAMRGLSTDREPWHTLARPTIPDADARWLAHIIRAGCQALGVELVPLTATLAPTIATRDVKTRRKPRRLAA